MSRDKGFARADIDVGLLDDPKVRQLIRSTTDEAVVARCLVAYAAVVLTSWERGELVPIEDAAPLWMSGLEDLAERLASVHLLDATGRIPAKTWDSWFGEALARRERGRDRWRRWNESHSRSPSDRPSDQPTNSQSTHTLAQRGANVGNGKMKPTTTDCPVCRRSLLGSETAVSRINGEALEMHVGCVPEVAA